MRAVLLAVLLVIRSLFSPTDSDIRCCHTSGKRPRRLVFRGILSESVVADGRQDSICQGAKSPPAKPPSRLGFRSLALSAFRALLVILLVIRYAPTVSSRPRRSSASRIVTGSACW